MSRKFTDPHYLDSASSPVHLPGFDPVIRTNEFNMNNASSVQWRLAIERLHAFNYFVTGLNFPGINIGSVYKDTPFSQIKSPGDSLNYEPLTVGFNVSEDFENILEIQRWMRGISPATEYRENRAITDAWNGKETSDGSLSLTTNGGFLETLRIHFRGLFPIALGGFDLGPVTGEIKTTVTFEYTSYVIERVPDGVPYE